MSYEVLNGIDIVGGGYSDDVLLELLAEQSVGAIPRGALGTADAMGRLRRPTGDSSLANRLAALRAIRDRGRSDIMPSASEAIASLREQMGREALTRAVAAGVGDPVAVMPSVPTQTAYSIAPFNQTLAAGATETVDVDSPIPFSPRRFSVAPELATYFRIRSIQIGINNYNLTQEGLPASCLSPDAVGRDWDLPTVQIGQKLRMTVQNVDTANPREFAGCWWGRSVQ